MITPIDAAHPVKRDICKLIFQVYKVAVRCDRHFIDDLIRILFLCTSDICVNFLLRDLLSDYFYFHLYSPTSSVFYSKAPTGTQRWLHYPAGAISIIMYIFEKVN